MYIIFNDGFSWQAHMKLYNVCDTITSCISNFKV
jgi:hypothetical protein